MGKNLATPCAQHFNASIFTNEIGNIKFQMADAKKTGVQAPESVHHYAFFSFPTLQ